MSRTMVRLRGVDRDFIAPTGKRLRILRGVELQVEAGEVVAITGESGVGKSTLLNLCGLLDSPSAGDIELSGKEVSTLSPRELARLRNEFVGFVFQFHHLLPELSALENVLMPALLRARVGRQQQQRARQLLGMVGVGDRADHGPAILSGGERQRVALARALMNRPSLVLADEPTGNLDPETAAVVQSLLFSVMRSAERAMVLVTHDLGLAARADRRLVLQGGQLVPA